MKTVEESACSLPGGQWLLQGLDFLMETTLSASAIGMISIYHLEKITAKAIFPCILSLLQLPCATVHSSCQSTVPSQLE